MSLFHTIIAAGAGTNWISRSVCCRKGEALLTPWKERVSVLCLKTESCIVFLVNRFFKNFIMHFLHFYKMFYLILLLNNKWKSQGRFGQGYDVSRFSNGMLKMWKNEVQFTKRSACFRNVGGQDENAHPASPALNLAAAAPTWRKGSDLFIYSSSGCSAYSTCSLFTALISLNQTLALSLERHSLALITTTTAMFSFTYTPEPQCGTLLQCYQAPICNLNPKCCTFLIS